jgi:hypothetical protein
MKKGFGGILMLLGTLVGVNSYAQKPAVVISNEPGWHKIGEISADFDTDTESISVLGADEFAAIKLKVTDAPVNIERLQVFYESGDMEEINVRSMINEGAETSMFDLKHPDRDIQKVTFTYKTVPNSKEEKADVELYGLKTNQPQGSDAYRRDAEKTINDMDREADEVGNDINREANEAEGEIKEESREAKENAKEAADKTENKTKEIVNDIGADLRDEKVEGKVGPNNETVYIDENGKYYVIDNAGKKVSLTKAQLKDKPNK